MAETTGQPLDAFTQAYIECALWASTDEDGQPLDEAYGLEDLAPEALADMAEDCRQFQADQAEDLAQCHSLEQAGQDFWLTRNRHGAGFWDRGLGNVGQRLTEASHAWGSSDLYPGKDGRLYLA